jgi:hypothetical protein
VTTRLAALLVLVTAAGAAQAQAPGRLRFDGSELFRFALHLHQVEPLTHANQALNRPETTMIVVMGDLGRVSGLLDGPTVRSYVRRGGAILIAADGPAGGGGRSWADEFALRITAAPVTADERHLYKGEPGRVFVRPVARPLGEPRPSPFDLFDNVPDTGPAAIATDGPSEMSIHRITFVQNVVSPLARYPNGASRLHGGRPIQDADNNFAVNLRPRDGHPAGRLLVVADRGVFSNGMMGFVKDDTERGYHFDNGNWEFTGRTIDWLRGGFQTPRTQCLFVEDGQIIDRFAVTVPNVNPPVPNVPPDVLANGVLNAMNPMIDAAQQKDFFNRVLEGWLGFPRLVRWFLLTVTIVFLAAGLRWLVRGRRRAEPAAVMTPQLQANLVPRGGVMRQRTAAQLEVGNLYDAARRRVRERFDVLGGRPGHSGQMPPVLTANDLRDGPVLHHSVRWLWALGYGDTPVAIPPADWDRTNVLLERVTARAARGDWSFGQEV